MAIATVNPADEVRSVDHNSIVGLLNGTADDATTTYAQPVKLYQFNDDDTFALTVGNQDTTNGLIQLWQYGTVGAATEVARMTRFGFQGLVADKGGLVWTLESFATDGAISDIDETDLDAVTRVNAAWTAAFAAVNAAGAGTIMLGPHTYLPPQGSITWPNYLTIAGAGMDSTTLIHRLQTGETSSFPILFFGKHHCCVRDLTIDGNAAGNATTLTNGGWGSGYSEISLEPSYTATASTYAEVGGYDNSVVRVRVQNYHTEAIRMGGKRNSVVDCEIVGQSLSSYAGVGNYGSVSGIVSSYHVVCEDLICARTRISGNRSSAIYIGGLRWWMVDLDIWDNHRELDSGGNGGGQLAGNWSWDGTSTTLLGGVLRPSPLTSTATGLLPGRDGLVLGCNVGARVGSGHSEDGGIEMDQVDGVLIANCSVNGTYHQGYKIASSGPYNTTNVRIVNCFASNINGVDAAAVSGGSTAVYIVQSSSSTTSNVTIDGMTIKKCRNAILTQDVTGTLGRYTLANISMEDCVAGWTKDDVATDYQSGGPGNRVYASSGSYTSVPLPNLIMQNNSGAFPDGTIAYAQEMRQLHTSGHGLRVSVTGTTAGQIVTNFVAGVGPVLTTYGSGQVSFAGALANGQSLNVQSQSELLTVASAATTDTAIQIPANSLVLGVTTRVTTVIPTAATFDVGIAGATTRYGSGFSTAATTTSTSPGTTNPTIYGSATSIRITPNATPANSTGRLRVTIWYVTATAATS